MTQEIHKRTTNKAINRFVSLKWKIAFSFVIIGVFTMVMLQLRYDWRAIVFGTLFFVFGSALLVWTEERKKANCGNG